MNYKVSDFLNSEKFTIKVNNFEEYKFEHSYHIKDMRHTLKVTGGIFGKDTFMISDNYEILSIFMDLSKKQKTIIETLELFNYNVEINSYLQQFKKVVNF